MSISDNLEIARPTFIFFISNMNPSLNQWIQYRGVELENDNILFVFKSSQNSLTFKVYAGLNVNDQFLKLRGKTTEISLYFGNIKDNI